MSAYRLEIGFPLIVPQRTPEGKAPGTSYAANAF
jgi:hypothetical protein